MIKYSRIFQSVNYRIDLLVDNATTHTKTHLDLRMFCKNANKSCPVEQLKWMVNGEEIVVDCFFKRGDLKGQPKGLFSLCKELGIINMNLKVSQISLATLRNLAAQHPAIKHTSKLEILVSEFNTKFFMNIQLLYVPKFHCELNPIEMYWANLKFEFRNKNEQSTNEDVVIDLILTARTNYSKTQTNNRIFSRFWRVISAYSSGDSYQQVMKKYFHASNEIKSHRKITHRN